MSDDYIKEQLDRIERKVDKGFDNLNGRVRTNEVNIARMQGKASTAGMISGAISGIVSGLAAYFGMGR